ncbi:hypothetical protein PSEUBRA_005683 [Kalmanozyma brasiliensis GHG001]|uniref:uncharacterized protein n=1 Tax=Kalmanozyma brasiliensis (strain GHG001) TaxID=1365824 RepID=UPI00286837E2|nr:uncharacterized protein PSEUBRA_005683 [Kalmanozyma brasiliensis GHG001]KAF6767547.1 hypothetical protein PSEUBRA_005683 [Kalmanozyma brasiliensis GHG001]
MVPPPPGFDVALGTFMEKMPYSVLSRILLDGAKMSLIHRLLDSALKEHDPVTAAEVALKRFYDAHPELL